MSQQLAYLESLLLKPTSKINLKYFMMLDYSPILQKEYKMEKTQFNLCDTSNYTKLYYDPLGIYKKFEVLCYDKLTIEEIDKVETWVYKVKTIFDYIKFGITHQVLSQYYSLFDRETFIRLKISFNPDTLLRRYLAYIGVKSVRSYLQSLLDYYGYTLSDIVDYVKHKYKFDVKVHDDHLEFSDSQLSSFSNYLDPASKLFNYSAEEKRRQITDIVIKQFIDEIVNEMEDDEVESP